MQPMDSQHSQILLPGTKLPHNYIISKVLGEGGFGITYSGILSLTNEKVAIKEYFPYGLARRGVDTDNVSQIVPFIGLEEAFFKGRQHFLNEASILKEFQNLNSIVSVKDVIEANGTVYLVMEYIDGITLKQYVEENGTLSFHELLPLIRPVIQALIQIHKQGLIHRDISPENLMIGIDNQLHLIDFGAASIENGQDKNNMTVILKSGYAPPEQYLTDGKLGAWTDIYALCTTMYMTLTGFTPSESIRRIQKDELPSLIKHADISSWQAAAIEKGMSLDTADRFQNMESLYQALIIPPIERNAKRFGEQFSFIEENKTIMKKASSIGKHRKPLYAFALAVLLFAALFTGVILSDLAPLSLSGNAKGGTLHTSTEEKSDSLCTMISLTGNSLGEAKEKLSKLDTSIKVNTLYIYDNTHAANTVIAQSIKTGTDFTKGSLNNILLTISKGAEPSSEITTEDTTTSAHENTSQNGKSTTQADTSSPTTQEKSNFDVIPIEEDEDYGTFTID